MFIICIYLQISSNIFIYLRISSYIFKYLQIFSNIFIFLQISTYIFKYLHISSNIFIYLHVSSYIYIYLHIPDLHLSFSLSFFSLSLSLSRCSFFSSSGGRQWPRKSCRSNPLSITSAHLHISDPHVSQIVASQIFYRLLCVASAHLHPYLRSLHLRSSYLIFSHSRLRTFISQITSSLSSSDLHVWKPYI